MTDEPPSNSPDLKATAFAASKEKAPIKKALVTGGSGFIGSHIVDHLAGELGAEVVVFDNLSTGRREFTNHHAGNDKVRMVFADVLDFPALHEAMEGCDTVFHMQANADVRGGMENRRVDLEQNTIATWNVLEAMKALEVKRLAFASSATVYGEPDKFPTPEDFAPLQTSLYGASKYACEGMIQAYGEYFGIRSFIYRFVSWTGTRYTHGVVYDFFKKLKADPKSLHVLGNGKQKKSYLDVTDGVAGIFHGLEHGAETKNIFNLGHDDSVNVLEVADIICEEMGLEGVEYDIEDPEKERGWVGDSPFVHLDTAKLKDLGWKPTVSIQDSIRQTVAYLKDHPEITERSSGGDEAAA